LGHPFPLTYSNAFKIRPKALRISNEKEPSLKKAKIPNLKTIKIIKKRKKTTNNRKKAMKKRKKKLHPTNRKNPKINRTKKTKNTITTKPRTLLLNRPTPPMIIGKHSVTSLQDIYS
jgi:hypothetical protein